MGKLPKVVAVRIYQNSKLAFADIIDSDGAVRTVKIPYNKIEMR